MSDLSPMLHQPVDNAPQIGGTRRPVMCMAHGTMMIRDWFGNPVCFECVENQQKLAELRENPVCPNCRKTDYLCAELEVVDPITPFRVLYIYCDSCESLAWEHAPSAFYWRLLNGSDQSAYLRPHGHLADWCGDILK